MCKGEKKNLALWSVKISWWRKKFTPTPNPTWYKMVIPYQLTYRCVYILVNTKLMFGFHACLPHKYLTRETCPPQSQRNTYPYLNYWVNIWNSLHMVTLFYLKVSSPPAVKYIWILIITKSLVKLQIWYIFPKHNSHVNVKPHVGPCQYTRAFLMKKSWAARITIHIPYPCNCQNTTQWLA